MQHYFICSSLTRSLNIYCVTVDMNDEQIISASSFQLLAGACLLIASKCNKVFVTEKDISYCCDNIFSVANVVATEEVVLKHLEWKLVRKLIWVTNKHFFSKYCSTY